MNVYCEITTSQCFNEKGESIPDFVMKLEEAYPKRIRIKIPHFGEFEIDSEELRNAIAAISSTF